MLEFFTDKRILTLVIILLSIITKKILVRYFKKRPYGDDKDSRFMALGTLSSLGRANISGIWLVSAEVAVVLSLTDRNSANESRVFLSASTKPLKRESRSF